MLLKDSSYRFWFMENKRKSWIDDINLYTSPKALIIDLVFFFYSNLHFFLLTLIWLKAVVYTTMTSPIGRENAVQVHNSCYS